ESHLHATWLACSGQPLGPSIAKLLVLGNPERPLHPDVRGPLAEASVLQESTERIKRVLDLLSDHLTPTLAPWYPGRDQFASIIAESSLASFEQAFNRWRELFSAAELQR